MAGQINILNPTLQDLQNARPLMRRCQNGDTPTPLKDANDHICTNFEVSEAIRDCICDGSITYTAMANFQSYDTILRRLNIPVGPGGTYTAQQRLIIKTRANSAHGAMGSALNLHARNQAVLGGNLQNAMGIVGAAMNNAMNIGIAHGQQQQAAAMNVDDVQNWIDQTSTTAEQCALFANNFAHGIFRFSFRSKNVQNLIFVF